MKNNPDNLTDEQIGVAQGWRLLDVDEVILQRVYCFDEIERWIMRWDKSGWCGHARIHTYRTRLTRAELRKARGLEPEGVTSANFPPSHATDPRGDKPMEGTPTHQPAEPPSEKATALQEYDSLKDQEFQQPAEAVSEAESLWRVTCIHHTDAERAKVTCPVCLINRTAAQQAEIAALREEAKRTENERRDWESIASSRLSLLARAGNELRDCRAELATTRERLAKREGELAAERAKLAQRDSALREIRDFCDGYIDGAPDAGPLGKLANRIDVIASRALEGQRTP